MSNLFFWRLPLNLFSHHPVTAVDAVVWLEKPYNSCIWGNIWEWISGRVKSLTPWTNQVNWMHVGEYFAKKERKVPPLACSSSSQHQYFRITISCCRRWLSSSWRSTESSAWWRSDGSSIRNQDGGDVYPVLQSRPGQVCQEDGYAKKPIKHGLWMWWRHKVINLLLR